MAKGKKIGRSKGSRNKGYFFRAGRGWFCKDDKGKFVPLTDEKGTRLKDEKVPESAIKAAHARWLLDIGRTQPATSAVTVREVCKAYLAHARNDRSRQTFTIRADALYDFSEGFPARFRPRERDGSKPIPKPNPSDRIHDGYGDKPVAELRPIDIDRWVQAHPDWNGGKRTKIQAVKRALNYAVDAELIPANPLKGVKTPKNNPRVTYITASQEKAILELANPAFTLAYRVLVRTGARPGREFAALTAAHVHDNAERMEWVFAARDSKNKKPRVIRIADPEIIAIVRRQMERYPTGPIFRNSFGDPWTREALSEYFLLIRERLEAKGIQLDKDACLYSLRHSYAKRTLDGYWTGKPTSIQRLARHMGNTVQVCMDHYLQWTESQDDSLWETC